MTGRNPAGLWRSVRQLYGATHALSRHQIWVLALLTAAGALSEVIAIGSVVPFLALLSNESATEHVPWAGRVFHAIGADTRSDQLLAATLFLFGAAIAAGVFRIALTRMTQSFAFSFGHRTAVEIQRRTLLQPYSWHVGHNSSEQLAVLEKVEIVATAVVLPLVQALAAGILILVVVTLLVQIAPLATVLAAILLGAAYYGLGAFARRRLQANSQRLGTAFEQRIRILQEGLGGIRDAILDGSQANILEQFRKVDMGLARARANTAFLAAVPRYLIEPAGIIIIAGLALLLSRREGGLVAALPVLGALALGAQRLLPLVQQLYGGWSNVAANKSVIDDVVLRLRLTVPATAPAGPRLPFAKAIEFRDVGYTYSGASEPAVSGLNFDLPKGSRIALVGRTGSGKSTTADLLMGLLEPTEGCVLVDGAELDHRNRQAWRANIAHVPQMLFLADASIARNIAMSEQPDMARVERAASLAQLDKFVRSLPDGFDTRVGERGARISGGERQRLALARAIYRDSPVLVLDEATSALDSKTEAAILFALDRLQEDGRTIVIISHREATIAGCDQVLKLRGGRLAAVAAATS